MNSTEIPHDVKKLKVDLSLEGMKKFVSTTIPEIKVYQDGIPTETRQLYLILEDLDKFASDLPDNTGAPYCLGEEHIKTFADAAIMLRACLEEIEFLQK